LIVRAEFGAAWDHKIAQHRYNSAKRILVRAKISKMALEGSTAVPATRQSGKAFLMMACKKSFPFVFPICRGKLQKVLDTYDGYSKRLKKAYTAGLKKRSDFSTLGYIYSDWAKDGFDGKQLTVTTYI
tara:strand:+ start:229 stop:612 length:384 start_codon:yes stop_codon:yes gene_type:complete